MTPAKMLIMMAENVIPSELRVNALAWWDSQFADRSQVLAFKDYSGNGRDATMYNFAGTTSDGWSTSAPYALKGDTTDSWIGREEAGFIAQDADFSYVCCFSPSTDNATTRLGHCLETNFTTGNIINFSYTTGSFSLYYYNRGGGSSSVTYTQSILNASYYIIGYTYTQTDRKFRLYINGILVATSEALTTGHVIISYMRHFRNFDGSTYTGHKLGFEGYFNKRLSDDEMKAVYNANCTRFGLAAA
jgi:hypothetical protein